MDFERQVNMFYNYEKLMLCFMEDVKYYFADFVRKGGEGYPPNP